MHTEDLTLTLRQWGKLIISRLRLYPSFFEFVQDTSPICLLEFVSVTSLGVLFVFARGSVVHLSVGVDHIPYALRCSGRISA